MRFIAALRAAIAVWSVIFWHSAAYSAQGQSVTAGGRNASVDHSKPSLTCASLLAGVGEWTAERLGGRVSEGAFDSLQTHSQREHLQFFRTLLLKDGDAWPLTGPEKVPFVYRGFAASGHETEASVLSVFLGMDPSHGFVQSHNFSLLLQKHVDEGLTVSNALALARSESIRAIQTDLNSAGSVQEYLSKNVERSLLNERPIQKDSDALFFTADVGVAQTYSSFQGNDLSIIIKVKNNGQVLDAPVRRKDEYQILSAVNTDDLEGIFIGKRSIRKGTAKYEYNYFQPVYRSGTLIGVNKYDVSMRVTEERMKEFDLLIVPTSKKFQSLRTLDDLKDLDFAIAAIERAPPFKYEDRNLKGEESMGKLSLSLHKDGVRYYLEVGRGAPHISIMTVKGDEVVMIDDAEKRQYFIREIMQHYGGADAVLNKIVDLFPSGMF